MLNQSNLTFCERCRSPCALVPKEVCPLQSENLKLSRELLNFRRSFPLKLVGDDAAGGDAQDAPGAPRPPRLLQYPHEQINVPAGKLVTIH